MKTISASEANRQFSSLLREVAAGHSVTIVSRGKPVATMAPVSSAIQREAARQNLLERLRRQPRTGSRNWVRDELYAD